MYVVLRVALPGGQLRGLTPQPPHASYLLSMWDPIGCLPQGSPMQYRMHQSIAEIAAHPGAPPTGAIAAPPAVESAEATG